MTSAGNKFNYFAENQLTKSEKNLAQFKHVIMSCLRKWEAWAPPILSMPLDLEAEGLKPEGLKIKAEGRQQGLGSWGGPASPVPTGQGKHWKLPWSQGQDHNRKKTFL